MIGKFVTVLLVAVLVTAIIVVLPDIKRYLRLRSM